MRIVILLVLASILTSGTLAATEKQERNKKVAMLTKSQPVEQIGETPIVQLSQEELFNCVTLTKDQVLEKYGTSYSIVRAGPGGWTQGYFYQNLGISFVFGDDGKVLWIDGNGVMVDGAKAGMTFSRIKKILGEVPIKEEPYQENVKRYSLEYIRDKCKIVFYAFKIGDRVKDMENNDRTFLSIFPK